MGRSKALVSVVRRRGSVDQLETKSASFIVRIWLEETAEEAGRLVWRGSITHVPSGERLYFEKLEAIADFVASYVKTMSNRP